MARIFISHSSKDDARSEALIAWLNARGHEEFFLDFDKHSGIGSGADWERKLYREIERCQAVIIVLTENWMESKWCFAEYTQARALGKAIFQVIETPRGDKLVATELQATDLTRDREDGLERLSLALSELAQTTPEGFTLPDGVAPFPGLAAFDEAHAAVFFGREDEIDRLREAVTAAKTRDAGKLIAVLGASGTGKSSLARAGLIPRLRRSPRNWIVPDAVRPEASPAARIVSTLLGLACPLADDGADIHAETRERLRTGLMSASPSAALDEALHLVRERRGALDAWVLLVIDQAEELFTRADEAARKQTFDLLARLASPGIPVVTVLTLRSDALGELQHAAGSDLPFGQVSLPPMPLERVGALVRGPARIANLSVDDGLVSALMRDAETNDALPLIAFTLERLYQATRDTGALTLQAYEALGDGHRGLSPLDNAVRKAADDALPPALLTAEVETALRRAFIPALVTVNDEGDFVRQPAREDDLPREARDALDRLVETRLLTRRSEAGETILEVAHEALFRVWDRLTGWLDEERDMLTGRKRLRDALEDWQALATGDRAGGLLTGVLLDRARQWLIQRPETFADDEKAFIQASADHAAELHAAEVKRREREARMQRRLAQGAVVAALIFAVIGGLAGWQWTEAESARQEAEQQRDRAEVQTRLAEEQRAVAEINEARALEQEEVAVAEAERAERNFVIALDATDSLALEIARQMETNFNVPTEEKIFVANLLEENFSELVAGVGDNDQLRTRFADLLISNAFVFTNVGHFDLARDRIARAEALLGTAGAGSPDTTFLHARVSLALAVVGMSTMDLAAVGEHLDRAETILDEIDSGQSGADRLSAFVLRARLHGVRAQLSARRSDWLTARRQIDRLNQSITTALADLDAPGDLKRTARHALMLVLIDAHRATNFLSTALGIARPSEVFAGVWETFEADRDSLGDADDPIWRYREAQVLRDLAEDRAGSGQETDAIEHISQSIDHLFALLETDRQNLIWRNEVGQLLVDRVRYAIQRTDFAQARVDIASARALAVALKRDTRDRSLVGLLDARLDYEVARLEMARGDEEAALERFEEMAARLDHYDAVYVDPGPNDDRISFALYGMGDAALRGGDNDAALAYAREALAFLDDRAADRGESLQVAARRFYVYALMLGETGRSLLGDEWPAWHAAALEQVRTIVAEVPDSGSWRDNLAYTTGVGAVSLSEAGRHAEAARAFGEALDVQIRALELEPDNDGHFFDVVYYAREHMESLAELGDGRGMLATIRQARNLTPQDLAGHGDLDRLKGWWSSLVSALEAALETVQRTRSAEAQDEAIDEDLRAELALARQLLKRMDRQIAERADSQGTAASGDIDYRSLDLASLREGDGDDGTDLDGGGEVMTFTRRLGFGLRPTAFPGIWRTLVEDELEYAVSLFVGQGPFTDADAVRVIERVRYIPVPFYDNGFLLEAEHSDDGGEPLIVAILVVNDQIYPLNGTSPKIHEANAASPIRLRDKSDVAAYLRFFGAYVAGEFGSFNVVEATQEIPWASNATNEVRAAIGRVIRPLIVWRDPEVADVWQASGTVQYSNALFHVRFQLQPTGMVEMLNDLPVAANLPISPPLFTDDGRAERIVRALDLSAFGQSLVTDEVKALTDLVALPEAERPAHIDLLVSEIAALRLAEKEGQDFGARVAVFREVLTLASDAKAHAIAYRIQDDLVALLDAMRADPEIDAGVAFAGYVIYEEEVVELARLALFNLEIDRALALLTDDLLRGPAASQAGVQMVLARVLLGDHDAALAIYRDSTAEQVDGRPWPDVVAEQIELFSEVHPDNAEIARFLDMLAEERSLPAAANE